MYSENRLMQYIAFAKTNHAIQHAISRHSSLELLMNLGRQEKEGTNWRDNTFCHRYNMFRTTRSPRFAWDFRRITFISILLFCFLTINPFIANSQSVVITDCQGITRAIHETRGTEFSKVQVQVSEADGVPSNGTSVELVDNVSGQIYVSQTSAGIAVFDGVAIGNYSLVVKGSNLIVGTVTIGSTGLGLIAASGVVIGAIAGAGGAVIGGVALVDEIDKQTNGNADNQPTPLPTTIPSPRPTSVPNIPNPTPTPCNCVPDAEPTPLDDFFNDKQGVNSRRQEALSPYR
jgi:hypothetical protein